MNGDTERLIEQLENWGRSFAFARVFPDTIAALTAATAELHEAREFMRTRTLDGEHTELEVFETSRVPPIELHEVVEGCLDCPHPDHCAGMGKCEIGAEKLASRVPQPDPKGDK